MNENSYITQRKNSVDKSPWRSVIIFFETSGKWWFSVRVLTVLSGLVSFGLTAANIKQLDPLIWLGLLWLGLAVAPIVTFYILRIQRDIYKDLWDDKAHVIIILREIGALRAEAVELQIEGMRLFSQKLLKLWIEKIDDWRKRTNEKVYELHPAEAGNFTTLGIFPAVLAAGTKPMNAKHQSELMNLVRRLTILGEIRDQWTTRRNL
jgi:hypothetical protein